MTATRMQELFPGPRNATIGAVGKAKKRKNPAAVALGRKGGKTAAGAGGRKFWADVPVDERSQIMRDLAERRWKKKAKKP